MPDGALANFSAIASEDPGLRSSSAGENRGLLAPDAFNAPIYGTAKGDRLEGDAGTGRLADSLNDIIFGDDGKDRIRGREGNDLLFGGEGDDRIRGDAGSDLLWGGQGDDRLIGDVSKHQGQDVFVLERQSGTDRIIDFQVGTDRLGLADGLTFDQLEFSQSRKDTIIIDGTSGSKLARLQNVQSAALEESMFVSTRAGSPLESPVDSPEFSRPDGNATANGVEADGPTFSEAPVVERILPAAATPDPGPGVRPSPAAAWSDDFSGDWQAQWNVRQKGAWGEENFEVLSTGGEPGVLRVHYPKGSAAPSVSRKEGVPLGGGQFYAGLDVPPQDSLRLSYDLRFADNFDFVKGGKLPGLFGGAGASGGNIPDGTDGFSTRLMWRREGQGEVYAYLPTSKGYGDSIGRGAWTFTPSQWHTVEQEVVLNQPGQSDGQVRVWLDGNLVLQDSGLMFRTTDDLQLDGIFFSTFFGGGDRSWSTPKDTHIDFANFSVSPGDKPRA